MQLVDGLTSVRGIWGDVPSWVSSVATTFALMFAAVAAVAARRTHRIESHRDQVNDEARLAQDAFARRAQAALVSAWWGESAHVKGEWGAHVRNASGAPIYQVYSTVLGPDDNSDDKKIHSPVVPPSDVAQFSPIDFGVHDQRVNAEYLMRRVKISFTDAAGVRWLRNQYGRLVELESKLRVKTDPERADVLTQFEDSFLATYGVTMEFQTDPERYPQVAFMADLRKPDLTDAVVCPHDWTGALVRDGMVEPMILSPDQRSAFPAWALEALTIDNRLYAVPMTTNTVALIRNTQMVPDAPATFDDLLDIGQALRDVGRVSEILAVCIGEHGDPFQTWPLFTSAGGSLFERTADGRWDPSRVGLGTAGSIAAFERFRRLGETGRGVLRREMDPTASDECFAAGRSPFLISTSEGLRTARRAEIPLAVSAVPPFKGGQLPRTFTAVHGLFVAARGSNKAIANDLFADYLTHSHMMSVISKGSVSPVALITDAVQDAAIGEYQRLCALGDLMPSIPAMERVWRILGDAQAAVVAGEHAQPVARRAAEAVKAAVDGQ